MNITTIASQPTVSAQDSRQQLLELARHLDRFGRQAEDFLVRKFEQLEQGIVEFEREKAAWRRQLRRESNQLIRQREELERLRSESCCDDVVSGITATQAMKNRKLALAARASGDGNVRILLRPNQATQMQLGLVLFEMSKLNRDMGGQGLTFEVVQVRRSRKCLFRRRATDGFAGKILELKGSSVLPLKPRGSHVLLDVDDTDRAESWIAFKTRLLQSCLSSSELAVEFQNSKPARDGKSFSSIQEAVGNIDHADVPANGYSGAPLHTSTSIGAVQQQFERLECCYETLKADAGLHIHVELGTST